MRIKDLNKLFYFKEAAESLNYTKAALHLQISPSGIQQAVKSLEESLGQKLFVRKSKGLALTLEGKILLDTVLKTFKQLELAEQALTTKQPSLIHKIKILSTPGLISEWICEALPLYRKFHPQLLIELRSSNIEISLKEEEMDIYIGPKIEAALDYKAIPLVVVHFRLYASHGYIDQYGKPEGLQDLKDHQIIKFADSLRAYFAPTNAVFTTSKAVENYAYMVDYYLAEYKLVTAHLGIACLARDIVKARYPDLVDLFPTVKSTKVPLFLYYRPGYGDMQHIHRLHQSLKETSPYNEQDDLRLMA